MVNICDPCLSLDKAVEILNLKNDIEKYNSDCLKYLRLYAKTKNQHCINKSDEAKRNYDEAKRKLNEIQ